MGVLVVLETQGSEAWHYGAERLLVKVSTRTSGDA